MAEVRADAGPGPAALLIANAAYPDSDAVLATPVGDARVLGDELKRRGFSVEIGENLVKDGMQAAIERLLRRAEPGSVAMIFFGGYGIQVSRRNYLIPVDARIWSEADVLRDGIGLDDILADLEKRGVGTRVVVLDASRRNPFERRFRSFSTGLAAPKAWPGTLALFSAATGSVLNETAASRSLFVTELVKQIALPDPTAEQAFGACRDAIAKATRNQQIPTVVSNLDDVFSFDPSRPKHVAATKPAAPAPELAKAPVVETKPVVVEPPALSEPAVADNAPLSSPRAEPEPPVLPESVQAPKPVATETPVAKPPTVTEAPVPPSVTTMASKELDAPLSAEDQAVRAFDAAQALGTRAAYDDFLSRYPTGSLAARARAEIARIDAAAQAAVAAQPVQTAQPQPPPKPYSDAELARKAALDQRIGRNPREAAAYYERGQFQAQRGDAPRAIADFDRAVTLDPGNAEAFNNRCWMRAVSNDLKNALADCNQALKLRQHYVDALDSRGFVNLKLGEYRAALSDYDSALKLEASHGSALYGRGVAKRKLGQTAQAEKDFASALQLNPAIDKEFAQYGFR